MRLSYKANKHFTHINNLFDFFSTVGAEIGANRIFWMPNFLNKSRAYYTSWESNQSNTKECDDAAYNFT